MWDGFCLVMICSKVYVNPEHHKKYLGWFDSKIARTEKVFIYVFYYN